MTATAVAWVLDELGTVVDAQPADHPLRRVDRDNSQVYEGAQTVDMSSPIRDRTGDLQEANFVGASLADRSGTPIGTEYDLDLETVVGIRIEGAHHSEWGHIDPAGTDGVVFEGADGSLVEQIRSAIYDGRRFPDAGRVDVSFTHLTITNEVSQSSDWADYYRYDFDVVFDGFEELS